MKENDKIFFDRHAGHKIELEKQTYHVIKAQDVVVVL
jgi:co-chaperonin GroES (HSP10)